MPIFGARYVLSQTPQHVEEFHKEINDREEALAQRDEDLKKRKEKLHVLQEFIEVNSRRNSTISVQDLKNNKITPNDEGTKSEIDLKEVGDKLEEIDIEIVKKKEKSSISKRSCSSCAQCLIQ